MAKRKPTSGTADAARMAELAALGREKNRVRRLSGKLLPQQEKFAQYMANTSSTASNAAVRAGYSKSTAKAAASRLLRDPYINARVETLRAEAGERNSVTLDEVIANLRDAHDSASAAGQFSAAIRASELLGKYLGMFSEKINVSHTGSIASIDTERLKAIGNLKRPA